MSLTLNVFARERCESSAGEAILALESSMPTMKTLRLSELKVGQSGRIVRLYARGGFRQRLLEMGLVRGECIEVKAVAPLGDPFEYSIKDYRLSLRKREAEFVLVEV